MTPRSSRSVCVHGLVGLWNFQAATITRNADSALAAGCNVVVKAPSEAPVTELVLAELAHHVNPANPVSYVKWGRTGRTHAVYDHISNI